MQPALLVLLAVMAAASAARVDYTGHMVIRVVPETEEQVKYLHYLQSHSSLDFWSLSGRVNQAADLRVSPDTYYDIARSLAERMMNHKILISDLGQLEKEEREAIARNRVGQALHHKEGRSSADFNLEIYHTFDEIKAYLTDLDNEKSIVKNQVIGTTSGGRDIIEVIIAGGAPDRPVIFFDCNINAREWIATATCLWIISQLANPGTNEEIQSLLNKYDWVFIPVANPDGYAYTWETNRQWRKNTVTIAGSECLGVDLNRNFPVGFGELGASASPCSENYSGTKAFSEQETISIRNSLATYRSRTKTALSIHSYGQRWMSPYGGTATKPTEYDAMVNAMNAGTAAIEDTYGTIYQSGNYEATLYLASGISTDYYYFVETIVHSYTLELRDKGISGYLLPEGQIRPTAIETWNGVKTFIETI